LRRCRYVHIWKNDSAHTSACSGSRTYRLHTIHAIGYNMLLGTALILAN
jgi:hypothetical protein